MSIKKHMNKIRKKFPLPSVMKVFLLLLLAIGVITALFIAHLIISFSRMKEIKPLESYSGYSVPTRVYDIKGRLITEFFKEKREIVAYKDLPPYLIQALVSTEDRTFFKHHGFNPWAMFKGVVIDPLMGKGIRGGSTISQQLAKGLFTHSEKTITRKLIELWYAFQIEKKYSKEEILELYFNQFEFGHGTHGIETAAEFYFKKHASELTLGEASLLAGLVNAPNRFSPIRHPYRAQARHRVVLNSMVEMGFITKAQADATFENFWSHYDQEFKNTSVSANTTQNNPAPYFTEYIRKFLLKKYGPEKLYNEGLSVYTTLDLDKQKIARKEMQKAISDEQKNYDMDFKKYRALFRSQNEDLIDMTSLVFGLDNIPIGPKKVKRNLENMTKKYDDMIYLSSFIFGMDDINEKIYEARYNISRMVSKKNDQVEGALVSLDPKNGYIEAMVGGKDFNYANQFNRATMAKRQMGSSFKAIYYSIALDNRLMTPATVFKDAPIVYHNAAGAEWIPRNYSGTFRGNLRVRQALQFSVNVVSVQVWDLLLRRLGYTRTSKTLSKFFGLPLPEIKKRVKPQMAFALGVGIFSPLEVAQAFSVFPNEGHEVRAIGILRVKDRFGKVLDDFEIQRNLKKSSDDRVISPQTAFIMDDLLSTVLFHGTGAGASHRAGFTYPAGGKTGTTSNWKDAWFAGFTPKLTTVVWIGFDNSSKSLGRHRSAARVAAPPWMRYMKQVCQLDPPENFHNPGGIIQKEIGAKTGLLATPYTPETVLEYFLPGTVPDKYSPISNANEMPGVEMKSLTDVNFLHETNNKENKGQEDPFGKIDSQDDSIGDMNDTLKLDSGL